MQFSVTERGHLLEFLIAKLRGKSRTAIKAMLANQLVRVDGRVATHAKHELLLDQIVEIGQKYAQKSRLHRGLKIDYEDEYLIVIEKPAGLLSVALDVGNEISAQSILSEYVAQKNHRRRMYAVHRLDRDTSGVMLFVKSKEMQRIFRTHWQQIVLRRVYAVIVEGSVVREQGTLKSWLHGTGNLRTYAGPKVAGAQLAISHYRVVKRTQGYTQLDVELETGRKNQVRVQMRELGHSIVGDLKYGSKQNPLGRLGLHARELVIVHPVTQSKMPFESALPSEFSRLCK